MNNIKKLVLFTNPAARFITLKAALKKLSADLEDYAYHQSIEEAVYDYNPKTEKEALAKLDDIKCLINFAEFEHFDDIKIFFDASNCEVLDCYARYAEMMFRIIDYFPSAYSEHYEMALRLKQFLNTHNLNFNHID